MGYKKVIALAALVGLALSAVIIYVKKPVRVQPVVQHTAAALPVMDQPAAVQAVAINGLPVAPAVAQKRPIAVMVENYIDARPQSGLVDADIVYEALAEGGITRFLAVYQTTEAKNIGPIRSARTYFAEFANELSAIYAHVGGNSDVLYYIKTGLYKNISDADQFFYDPFFHRISSRKAPHNVYTSVSKIDALAASSHFKQIAAVPAWLFKDDAPQATTTAGTVRIDFSLPDYFVSYTYDPAKNIYLRSQAGRPHVDADTGKQITAKNVIVQFTETHPVKSDTPFSIGMNLLSGGTAYVFLDGGVTAATWKRSPDARTRYYDSSGREIALNRGQTWVEIVPTGRPVAWK